VDIVLEPHIVFHAKVHTLHKLLISWILYKHFSFACTQLVTLTDSVLHVKCFLSFIYLPTLRSRGKFVAYVGWWHWNCMRGGIFVNNFIKCNYGSAYNLHSFLLLNCTDALPFYNAYFGEHSSPGPNITSVRCYGNESQLLNCRHSMTTTCRISNVAGVRCQGEITGGVLHNVTIT